MHRSDEAVPRHRIMSRLLLLVAFVLQAFIGLSANAMTVTCDKANAKSPVLNASGDIVSGDDTNFRSQYAACFENRDVLHYIRIHSGGGDVAAAIAISNFLLGENNVWTSVAATYREKGEGGQEVEKPGYCISACTYIFLAGVFRDVPPGASFEPHGFSSWRNFGNPVGILCRLVVAVEAERYQYMGALYEKMQVPWIETDFCNRRAEYFGKIKGILGATTTDKLLEILITVPGERLRVQDSLAVALTQIQAGALGPNRRMLLNAMRNALATSLSEMQREVALLAYHRAQSNQTISDAEYDEIATKYTQNWISASFDRAFQNYFEAEKVKMTVRDVTWTTVGQIMQVQVKGIAMDAAKTMRTELMGYLAARHSNKNKEMGLDDAKLMNLMFSTSIIYMRPLSREELCDINVVTRGCD